MSSISLSLAFSLTALIYASAISSVPVSFISPSMPGVHKMPIQKLGNTSLFNLEKIQKLPSVRGKELNGLNRGAYRQQSFGFNDLYYTAKLAIGTPPQEFAVLLDTGSTSFWVVDKSCDSSRKCAKFCKDPEDKAYCYSTCDEYCCEDNPIDKTSTCENKKKFDSSKSKTYKKDGREENIHYGRFAHLYGFADYFIGNDTLKFGGISDSGSMSVPGVMFGQATSLGKNLRNYPIDGILGLGYHNDRVETPLMTAIRRGLLAAPMFTVYLERDGHKGGVFTYGGLDKKNCGPVRGWIPLTHDPYLLKHNYQFEIEGVIYGKKYRSKKRQQVVTDTGSSMIIGDPKIVTDLAKQVGAIYKDKYNLYLIDCDADYEPITFKIRGKLYSLPKEVLTIDMLAGDQSQKLAIEHNMGKVCVFGIMPLDLGKINWILGNPFIRQYCNIHDIGNKRMGFAPSIQPKGK